MSAPPVDTSKSAQQLSSDFWKFWIGQSISTLGSSITSFALPLLILKLTGSALNLATFARSIERDKVERRCELFLIWSRRTKSSNLDLLPTHSRTRENIPRA
jgi:hypothetical protein